MSVQAVPTSGQSTSITKTYFKNTISTPNKISILHIVEHYWILLINYKRVRTNYFVCLGDLNFLLKKVEHYASQNESLKQLHFRIEKKSLEIKKITFRNYQCPWNHNITLAIPSDLKSVKEKRNEFAKLVPTLSLRYSLFIRSTLISSFVHSLH